jgi:hypothetical protein
VNTQSFGMFDEALYLATFPDIAAKVAAGEYKSGLDYYTKVGQFKGEDLTEGFFTGTPGNDIISGFGADKDLYGIGYKDITLAADGTVTLTPTSLGVGEVDILVGTENFDGNYLVAYNSFNFETLTADTEQLYVGNGDKDYALIKNLDPSDGYITISSTDLSEFDYRVDGQGFKIYYKDDLVGIAEGIYDLQIGFFVPSLELAALSKTTESGVATGGFDEDLYLLFTPAAVDAIAKGTFKSGLEYYVKVGQNTVNAEGEPGEGFFTGTSGNDFVIGFGANAGLSGVGITAVDPALGTYTYDSLGVGEVDVLIGGEAENSFLLGTITNPATPEPKPFYVGKGDEDYARIKNFNPGEAGKDQLILAGNPDDYRYEIVEGNTKISYRGDLVAIVEGVEGLQVSGVFSDFGIFTLNQFPVERFNSDVYAAFNPDTAAEIGEGKPFKTVLDYYVQKGQFREDGGGHGFFNGTDGNDVLQGFGFDEDIFGVGIQSVEGTIPGKVKITPTSTGEGQIDTMIGSQGVDGFYSAIFTEVDTSTFQGASTQLYLGQGDRDYVRIKNFDAAKDYLTLSGRFEDFTFKVEDGNFKAYKGDDLVAIVEDTANLQPAFVEELAGLNILEFKGDTPVGFDEALYLNVYPEVAKLVQAGQFKSGLDYHSQVGQYETLEEAGETEPRAAIFAGTEGNNTIIGWGRSTVLSGVGYDVDAAPFSFKPKTTGVGEKDTLVGQTGVNDEFVLGLFQNPGSPSAVKYYVGQGDADYAMVRNFKLGEDSMMLAGRPDEYRFEEKDGNLRISTGGDLVAIAPGVRYSNLKVEGPFPEFGVFVLS